MPKEGEYSLIESIRNLQAGLSGKRVEKTITFDGGTTNDIGDHDGTGNPGTLFTITGTVIVNVIAVCTTTLVGASSTLELGITGDTASIIAQTTGTDIDVGEIWHDASPDKKIESTAIISKKIIANGSDIILTVATANITAGVIDFYLTFTPVSDDGNVVAA